MERLLVYLTSLSTNFAYLVIFGILLACGLGFPLPEDVPLIATGYLIWEGTMTWVPALLVTLLGVLLGDTILFFLGKRVGKKILRQHRFQTIFPPARVRRAGAYFRKYGDKLIFFARFVAGLRAVVFFMAGAMKVRYWRFLLLDGLAALLSVPAWVLLGYGFGHFFGDQIQLILKHLKEVKIGFSVVLVVVLLAVAVRWYRGERARKKTQKRHSARSPKPNV
jgi:membrane protein DedA with SNARE-associated domain